MVLKFKFERFSHLLCLSFGLDFLIGLGYLLLVLSLRTGALREARDRVRSEICLKCEPSIDVRLL